MKHELQGWNDFYDGWLAYVTARSEEIHEGGYLQANEAYKAGWQTASETSGCRDVREVILAEISESNVRRRTVPDGPLTDMAVAAGMYDWEGELKR